MPGIPIVRALRKLNGTFSTSSAVRTYDSAMAQFTGSITRFARYVAAPLLLIGATNSAEASPLKCLSTWSEASPVVTAQQLASVEELNRQVAKLELGELLMTTLCHDGDRYVYRLMVRSTKGRVRTLTVDADQPFGR